MSVQETYRDLLEAASFAARAHRHHLRKDGQTPYVSHVFRVSLVVRHIFGVDDPQVLTAALLHDTIEDTTTDFDEIEERFGPEVASWVCALSKDKRLQDDEREKAYIETLAGSPWQVKVCKLADVFDNLMDSTHFKPEQRAKSLKRAESYLAGLKSNLPPQARQPYDVVLQLFNQMKQADASACSTPG
jgi:guanosine-3',5'-bis(diphosphate) 3'-pyrophosphohydrolase